MQWLPAVTHERRTHWRVHATFQFILMGYFLVVFAVLFTVCSRFLTQFCLLLPCRPWCCIFKPLNSLLSSHPSSHQVWLSRVSYGSHQACFSCFRGLPWRCDEELAPVSQTYFQEKSFSCVQIHMIKMLLLMTMENSEKMSNKFLPLLFRQAPVWCSNIYWSWNPNTPSCHSIGFSGSLGLENLSVHVSVNYSNECECVRLSGVFPTPQTG